MHWIMHFLHGHVTKNLTMKMRRMCRGAPKHTSTLLHKTKFNIATKLNRKSKSTYCTCSLGLEKPCLLLSVGNVGFQACAHSPTLVEGHHLVVLA
jgi:hypothetical protein